MILSAIVSFFGGSAFRMIWGELSAWLTARQDHRREVELLELQERVNAAQHLRNLESIRVQAEQQVQVIRVQGEANVSQVDAEAWGRMSEATTRQTGITWVDAWNGCIRPLLATICTALVVLHFYRAGWVLDDQGWGLIGAVLGIYVADRSLFKRGK